MDASPYSDIRQEAFEFIEWKVEPVNSMRDNYQRTILETSLRFFIRDIENSHQQSFIYREFLSYFTG